MSIFKSHKVSACDLLDFIPDELMSRLAESTEVDYYAKVLQGKKLFNLLLYGILESERLSQRTLVDIFNDPFFKTLFNLDIAETVSRSSISERLSKISPDYFRQIFDHIYEKFSEYYLENERHRYNIIRVDSTIISDTSGKITDGMDYGSVGNKIVKYGVAFDGVLPCCFDIFTAQSYASEDKTLPAIVRSHIKQERGHRNIYVMDRGLQSARNMSDFSSDNIAFIARIKENRKYVELESLLTEQSLTEFDELTLLKDSKVHLYTGKPVTSKSGNIHRKQELVEQPLRLIVARNKQNAKYWFITNDFELPASEVCRYYKRRWDIEVFFRFIKQELNTKHLISLNQNGIQVVLYMILIVAMLLLIYKRANNIGYKTAKRRFKMEIRNMIIAMIVVYCGGDPTLFFKYKKE